MDGTLVVHIIIVLIIFLAILACRMYCRKRNKHRQLRLLITRINPMSVTPVLQPFPQFISSRQSINPQVSTNLNEHLPGTTGPNSAELSAPSMHTNEAEDGDDQISLESHTVEIDISTSDYIKSPPPPYSAGAGDLPTYEEAIRYKKEQSDT